MNDKMGTSGVDSTANFIAGRSESVTSPVTEYSTTTLVKYDAMCHAIELASAVDEVKDIRDKAVAIQMYARQAKNLDAERRASEIRIRAERRCGELLTQQPRAKGAAFEGNPGKGNAVSYPPTAQTLSSLGITRDQSSEWQKLAAIPESEFEAAIASDEIPSTNGVLNHRARGTGENEWYTPAEYIQAARDVLGEIELDPASSVQANETVMAKRFFSKANDGLVEKWEAKTLWMNPPYAQPLISQFMQKLREEYACNGVIEAIALTNDSSDTEWFHGAAHSAQALCFTRGRIGFISPDEGIRSSPLQGQVFFYFGPNLHNFARRFQSIGLVVVPYVL